MEHLPRLLCWIILLRLIHGIKTFFCKAYTGILGFLAQPFCGLFRFCQIDTKELIYLAHVVTANIFHFVFNRDWSMVLFCLAYTLLHLVESLRTITYIITYMPMTHHFIYHFNQRIHIHICLLTALLTSCRGSNQQN